MNKIKISFKDYAIIRFYLARNGDTPCYYNATCFIFARSTDSKPKAYCRVITSFNREEKVQKFTLEHYGWYYSMLKDEFKNCLDTHHIYTHTPWASPYNIENLQYSTIYFRVPIYHLSLTTHQIPNYYTNDKRLISFIREILIRIGKSVAAAIVNGVEET